MSDARYQCIQRVREFGVLDDEERKQILLGVLGELPAIENMDEDVCAAAYQNMDNIYERIFTASYLLAGDNQSTWMEELLENCIDSNLSYLEKYFVYTQAGSLLFNTETINSDRTDELMDTLYAQVCRGYMDDLGEEPDYIPIEERNKDFVLVLTGQFLQIQHGPTKTILDRCRIIQEKMGKDILLVNLAMILPFEHIVPMYKLGMGSYIEEFSALEQIDYEGVSVPFVQMEHHFPTIGEISGLIELVREFKPYQIVSVDDGIIVDVLSRMVSTLVISLTPSELRRTYAQYIQIGRPVNDEDRVKLKRRGKTENNVISAVFSSRLAAQKKVATRAELHLPENARLGVVIGGRLNVEVTRDFLIMMRECMEHGLYLLFLGDVSSICEDIHDVLGEYEDHVIRPGMVSDTLMYLDHCYLYFNPIRRGGGTSSVEAMSKGVVPLTTEYGDVYTNVGDDFLVQDYKDMAQQAIRLMDDEVLYQELSEKAVLRSERMLDSTKAFEEVMNEFEKRMREE